MRLVIEERGADPELTKTNGWRMKPSSARADCLGERSVFRIRTRRRVSENRGSGKAEFSMGRSRFGPAARMDRSEFTLPCRNDGSA
jgi:hypothetical protein